MNRTTLLRLALWTVTLGYWVMAFIATHRPPGALPRVSVSDKTLHFSTYLFIAGLLTVSLWSIGLSRGRALWLTILVCLIYAAIDEITQIPVGRTADILDWVADGAGTVLAAGVLWSIAALTNLAPPRRPAAGRRGRRGGDSKHE